VDKKRDLETNGYFISPVRGGQPRKVYYTPDGRTIKAIPSMREYQYTDENGEVVSGERDANYDKGWLDRPPKELKPYCPYCDRWHDTEAEIEACAAKHKKLETWGMQQARRMHPKDFETFDKITAMENRISGLESGLGEILSLLREKK